nr:MAG TPA: hypothetical protein [Bacteriophage sp.]DAT51610.1 MAG TPA: hypothetical protein [Caudoviricetes sp.]DAY29402.1 MAG TPA: hypothetical protein [Caudoviricetes sp.]
MRTISPLSFFAEITYIIMKRNINKRRVCLVK